MAVLNHFNAALRVCVNQVQDGHISGQVFSRRLTEPLEFSDIGNLLLQVEVVLNVQNFPQAFQRTRTFGTEQAQDVHAALSLEEGMSAEMVDSARGELYTFLVAIITRRNTTWQGNIDWLDGGEPTEFSSVLDLIKLTDQHIVRAQ